jgi:hypothetical protein
MLTKLGMKTLMLQVVEAGVMDPKLRSRDVTTRLKSKHPETIVGVPHRYWPVVRDADLGAGRIDSLRKFIAMGYEPTTEDAGIIFDGAWAWTDGSWALDLFRSNRYLNYRTTMDYLAKHDAKARSQYEDYLRMAKALHLDMKSADVLRPKDLKAEHDRLSARMEEVKQQHNAEGVRLAAEANRSLEIAMNGMLTRVPNKPEEIVREGQTLHHCVGSYAERVAKGECLIVFVRQEAKPDEPYVTVEIRDNAIKQVRAKNNASPPPEVEKFISAWVKSWGTPARRAG